VTLLAVSLHQCSICLGGRVGGLAHPPSLAGRYRDDAPVFFFDKSNTALNTSANIRAGLTRSNCWKPDSLNRKKLAKELVGLAS